MYQKSNLIFTTIVASLLLVACDSGTNENASSNQHIMDSPAITQVETAKDLVAQNTNLTESDTTTDIAAEKMNTSSMQNPEPAQEGEEVSNNPVQEEVQKELQEEKTVIQPTEPSELTDLQMTQALERILTEAKLDKRLYRFNFEKIEDYIQVEVREKDEEVAALQGIYRYNSATDEVLHSDYLTGDFVPFN